LRSDSSIEFSVTATFQIDYAIAVRFSATTIAFKEALLIDAPFELPGLFARQRS
jgi:hypothetical protein